MSKILIGRQFRGPPNSGNGGYVCGVLAKGLDGPVTAMLRAPPPLDVDLDLGHADGGRVLSGEGGLLIGQAGPAIELPDPPPAPSLAAAREAGARSIAHTAEVHPPCFTCGARREDGLRVLPGQLAGAAPGVVACVWTPEAAFSDAFGFIPTEIVWAALDCPGIFAWIETQGRSGNGLLGTMTGEVVERVRAGEDYVVLAWPIEASGRKKTSGVALYDGEGRVVARGHQVWISMNRASAPPAAAETATA